MKLTTILPVIYGLALFSLVRLANDIPLGSNYLEHSSLFITIEIVGGDCGLLFVIFLVWTMDKFFPKADDRCIC